MFLHGPNRDVYISDSIITSSAAGGTGGRYFEQDIAEQMDSSLEGQQANDTLVLDIGANIGLHALYFASKGFMVHAFEPAMVNFALLQCSKVANRFDKLSSTTLGSLTIRRTVALTQIQQIMAIPW